MGAILAHSVPARDFGLNDYDRLHGSSVGYCGDATTVWRSLVAIVHAPSRGHQQRQHCSRDGDARCAYDTLGAGNR